jgi:hypothetical protein
MNTVTVENGHLIIEPRGLDKLWSFRRKIDVPLAQVRGATADEGVRYEPKGIRAPGLAIPGKYSGTFHRDGEKTFWNVSDPVRNVVLELDGTGMYNRLVLTVENPGDIETLVNAAISR